MTKKPSDEWLEKDFLELKRNYKELNLLYQAVTALNANLSLDDTLKTIAVQVSDALSSSGCAILLWHREKNQIENVIDHNRVYHNLVDKPGQFYDLTNYPAPLSVLKSGKPLIISVDDPTADPAEVALMRELQVFVSLLVPLKTSKRIFGYLEIYENFEPRDFTEQEIRFAEHFAYQAAIALENARMYRAAQNEINRRQKTEKALQQSKELFDSFMSHLPALAFMKKRDGRYIYLNKAYKSLYGIDPKTRIGKTDDELFPADIANSIKENDHYVIKNKKVLNSTEKVEFNGRTYHQLISKFPIFKDGRAILLAGIAFDITDQVNAEREREQLEHKLQRSQRMEALGLLAGGVAHDLNNILSGIVSYPELLLLDLPEDSPLREPIVTIQKSGQRAAEVVQDLLTLARRGVVQTEVVNLHQIISDYLSSPEHRKTLAYHPSISVEYEHEPDLLNIKGSTIHLKKSIMNLVSNAAESQPRGGNIRLQAHNKYMDKPLKGSDDFKEGDYVVIQIEDDGEGIAPDDLNRIFEPFYTKKVMGRSGTGLGMSVVWGTVQDHKGFIDVDSAPGRGTTIELFFPATREELAEKNQLVSVDEYMGNRESILVVDDVTEQRDIASKLLTRLGYSVKTVPSGEEAVKYLKDHAVDLVILDMIMAPGIDGLETYKRILRIHPNQKAVIASGFSETRRVHMAQKLGAGQYLKKPYTLEKIGLAIKDSLKHQTPTQ